MVLCELLFLVAILHDFSAYVSSRYDSFLPFVDYFFKLIAEAFCDLISDLMIWLVFLFSYLHFDLYFWANTSLTWDNMTALSYSGSISLLIYLGVWWYFWTIILFNYLCRYWTIMLLSFFPLRLSRIPVCPIGLSMSISIRRIVLFTIRFLFLFDGIHFFL